MTSDVTLFINDDDMVIEDDDNELTVIMFDFGIQGVPGLGIPSGGTTFQVLVKASNADYDTRWISWPTGGQGIIQLVDLGGTANAITATTFPPLIADDYPTGQSFYVRPLLENTDTVDIKMDGFTFKDVVKPNGDELLAGEWSPAVEYIIKYDGTRFRIVTPTF